MTAPPPADRASAFSVLRLVLARRYWSTAGLVLCSVSAGLAESAILALVAQAATAMVDGDDRVMTTLGPIVVDAEISVVLAVAAILGIARLAVQAAVSYLPAQMSASAQSELRHGLFDAYSRASWETQADERDGHLQELLTNQVPHATLAAMQATNLLSQGLMFLTLVFVAFLLGPLVAFLVLAVAGSLFAVLRPLGTRGRRHAKRMSQAQMAYANSLGAAVRLAEETYTFGVAAAERERLRDQAVVVSRHYLWTQFSSRLAHGLYQGIVILLLVGGLAAVLATGAGRDGSLGAVILILMRASSYGQQAQLAWHGMEQSAPHFDRLNAARDRYLASPPKTGDQPFPVQGTLRLHDVSFAYRADRPVLEGIHFEAASGEVLGIVGPSGAGKSTLIQLLMRMREPTSGRIDLSGIPIHDITLDEWRRQVAYVPQEPRLLQATVADNIRFDRDIPQASVEHSAKLAHIHEEIMAMPDGYETQIGQRADAVSGGQRQRLCLARALAGSPSMLVLDEPTSALDMGSEEAIRASLHAVRGELTMFIVTHRPTLLEICDRVIHVGEDATAGAPHVSTSTAAPSQR